MHYLASLTVIVAVLAIFPAEAEEVTELDRFRLWNECRTIRLVVEDMSEHASTIGLTKRAVETAVRSRLRAARLYDSNLSNAYFYVRISIGRQALNIDVSLEKTVAEWSSNETGYATTWHHGSFGTHG